MDQARFWEPAPEGKVRCGLCRFRCLIGAGQRGVCGVRENREGVLYTLVYGRSVAEAVDPVEKKPLYHFHPGSSTFSIATVGCNFRCLHCQNHQISQWPQSDRALPGHELLPAQAVAEAQNRGCASIAYTYTEPTIFFEYAYDIAVLARQAGLGNIFVTNGYITAEALAAIAPYLDAANVDLKGFSERFYREVAGATLNGVLDSLREYRRLGIWIEVTTLVIPGLNDAPAELREMAHFIATELGIDTPWHLSAFHPTYRMLDRPPTPAATLRRARQIGLEAGLRYVYLGNLSTGEGEDTLCPGCQKAVISRRGVWLQGMALDKGRCGYCGTVIAGVGLGE
jgi:pyruvate formate lyase activating enzyme